MRSSGLWLRSLAFNIGWYLGSVLFALAGAPLLLAPRRVVIAWAQAWIVFVLWWLRVTCGLTHRVIGLENLPAGPVIIACKHQSSWETLAFTPLPSLRRLTLEFDVPQAWQRREDVEPGNLEVERAARSVRWAIWRPELVSNFRSLDEDDAALLDALADGRTFPELCEAIARFTGEEQAPVRATGLLRAWVEGGLIAGFRR